MGCVATMKENNGINGNIESSSELVAVTTNNDVTKEYLDKSKKLLEDFKKMQNVIMEAQGPDISILIKVAQNNLTKTAMEQASEMIKEFQGNFNEDSVEDFIEHSISLITSIETANYLYGSIIDIQDIRKYIHSSVQQASALLPYYGWLQILRLVLLALGLGCWICPLARRQNPRIASLLLGLALVMLGEFIGRGLFYGLHMTVGTAIAG